MWTQPQTLLGSSVQAGPALRPGAAGAGHCGLGSLPPQFICTPRKENEGLQCPRTHEPPDTRAAHTSSPRATAERGQAQPSDAGQTEGRPPQWRGAGAAAARTNQPQADIGRTPGTGGAGPQSTADIRPRATVITTRRPRPRQKPTSPRRLHQRRPRGEPASENAAEPSQVAISKGKDPDYANGGKAAMDSRASDAINKSKVDTCASNPSQRRPSRLWGKRSLALPPRLECLFRSSCGSRRVTSRPGFPPPEGSHLGCQLLPL
ncbi:uncharacterized protein CSNK1G2-AS1 [Pongo abelii]|uniref:uncharacterized protein CSNK1G2-AS1 n=1 Tax=Pongo abelii TaxID=9601 RepID=UPI003004A20E